MSQYQEVNPISRREAIAAFASEEPQRICDALIRLTYHDSDWRWVQEQCEYWATIPNLDIQGLAITCLGHLARIHRKLDTETALPLLRDLANNPLVAPRVDDAVDDIEAFLNIEIREIRGK